MDKKNADNEIAYESTFENISERTIGKAITQRLSSGDSIFLTGPHISNTNDAATFLYFHRTISLQICPHCPQARDPSMITPLLDRNLLSVFMIGPYTQAPSKFQEVVSTYPESFVGQHSYSLYRRRSMHTKLNLNYEISRDEHGAHLGNHYCLQCIYEKLEPYSESINKMKPKMRSSMVRTANLILAIPAPIAEDYANAFANLMENSYNIKDTFDQNVKRLGSEVSIAEYMACAKSLNARPQINVNFLEMADFFTNATRINLPPGMDIGNYLDLVEKYRGKLSVDLVGLNNSESILSKAAELNSEIESINSAKGRFFFYKFLPIIPQLIVNLVKKGEYGGEIPVKDFVHYVSSTAIYENTRAAALAKYFGISKAAAHIWSIRKELGKTKVR